MKKRILSFVLAAALGGFGCMPISDVRAEENGTEPETAGRGFLLYETDMVTRKDFKRAFRIMPNPTQQWISRRIGMFIPPVG